MSRRFVPGASRLALAWLCGFPWSEDAPTWPPRATTSSATFGTAFGRCVELLAIFGGEALETRAVVDLVAEGAKLPPSERAKLLECACRARDYLESSEPEFRAVEVCVLYDPATNTARLCAPDEKAPEGWQKGAADIVEMNGGRLFIGDFKSGERTAAEGDAKTDTQLLWYAIALPLALGYTGSVDVALLHASEDGIRADGCELSTFDVAMGVVGNRRLLESLPTAKATPGRHCAAKYCPMAAACPETMSDLASLDAEAAALMKANPQTPEEARETRNGIARIRRALPQFEAGIEAFALKHGPFEVAEGVVYGARQVAGSKRYHVVNGVPSVLRHHLGEHADEALDMSTSGAAIERAARAHAAKVGLDGRGAHKRILDPILEELAGLEGAITRGAPSTRFEEFKQKAKPTTPSEEIAAS